MLESPGEDRQHHETREEGQDPGHRRRGEHPQVPEDDPRVRGLRVLRGRRPARTGLEDAPRARSASTSSFSTSRCPA
ncbi:MAG: hypothetical protein MZV70_66535 [Desulfobacterales bacterium]|nr:hypothetical protein [Desulfobacterales bacterium]